MEADQNIWSIVAPIVGVVVAVLTMTRFVVSGIEYLLSLPDRIRRYYFRPKFILIPTAEEMAKYAAKEPDRHAINSQEVLEEISTRIAKEYLFWRRKSRASVFTIGLYMVLGYCSLIFYIFYIRLYGINKSSLIGPLDTGNGLFNGYLAVSILTVLILLVVLIFLLLKIKMAPIITALKRNF